MFKKEKTAISSKDGAKTNLKEIMLIFLLIACLGLCGFCLYFFAIQDWDHTFPDKENLGSGLVLFEPEQILSDIRSGNVPLFESVYKTPEYIFPDENTKSYYYSEDDYFAILKSFFEYHWEESIDDWQIAIIRITIDDCAAKLNGPVSYEFVLQKPLETGRNSVTLYRQIAFYNWSEYIYWHEYTEEGAPFKGGLSWEEAHGSGMNALYIAEQNGGIDARNDPQNHCEEIYMSLVLGIKSDWKINYSDEQSDVFYSVSIDAISGKIIDSE